MNTLRNSLKLWDSPKYWLLAIATGLIAIHLTLTWRSDNIDVLGTSLLFWGAGAILMWEKKDSLDFETELVSTLVGISIIALVLLKSLSISGYDIFLRFSPLISGLGLGLVASGFKGLKQYWQELLIVGFIAIPPGLILKFIDVAPVTARFTHFILHYLGVNVTRQGVHLIVANASLEVASGCTGVGAILQLLGLGILVLLMFPTNLRQKIFVLLTAIVVAFVVNGVRVALMTYLLAFYGQKAFEYWHYGDGSLIFSMIAVAIFGLFCWFTVLRDEPKNSPSGE